jgi:hypothetical protein
MCYNITIHTIIIEQTRMCPQDIDAPTAATEFLKLTKGHNSGKKWSQEKNFSLRSSTHPT